MQGHDATSNKISAFFNAEVPHYYRHTSGLSFRFMFVLSSVASDADEMLFYLILIPRSVAAAIK